MLNTFKVRIWTAFESHHSDFFYEAVAAACGGQCDVVYLCEREAAREALGWRVSPVQLKQRRLTRLRQFAKAGLFADDRIHIFNGMWGSPLLASTCLAAALRGLQCALITEPALPGIRPLRHAAKHLANVVLRARVRAVFAISKRAAEEMSGYGFPPVRIFPFGYFLPGGSPGAEPAPWRSSDVLFLGQFIQRKGLLSLVEAWQSIPKDGSRLRLVGTGPLEGWLRRAACADSSIVIEPPVLSEHVPALLSAVRAVILPSLHDGWGAVINEAIGAGIPALCSDRCGSAELVEAGGCGRVFAAGDATAIREALLEARDPAAIRRWSMACRGYRGRLTPQAAASYFVRCLTQPDAAPPPPWRNC